MKKVNNLSNSNDPFIFYVRWLKNTHYDAQTYNGTLRDSQFFWLSYFNEEMNKHNISLKDAFNLHYGIKTMSDGDRCIITKNN